MNLGYSVRMNESLESVKTLNKCIRTLTTWYLSYTEVYKAVTMNQIIGKSVLFWIIQP